MSEAPKLTSAVTSIVEVLSPLESQERIRIVRAALTLLGDQLGQPAAGEKGGADAGEGNVPPRAGAWARQNGLSFAQLEGVFHFQNGEVQVIAADIPGKGKKGKTVNAFVLQGIRGLLSAGEPTFDDKAARLLCKNLGCYDEANHAVNIKEGRNFWIGSKENGWLLTAPGLKYGAALIKQMSASAK